MALEGIHRDFLHDLGYWLRERGEEAAREARSEDASEFVNGRAEAYYEVISHAYHQAENWDIALSELGFDGLDPQRDLL